MMCRFMALLRDQNAAAAVEMALVTPLLLALMFGSVELGNLFLDQHSLEKQVRDGARFAARMELSSTYACSADPSTVFAASDAATQVSNVTKTGVPVGTGNPRWDSSYWTRSCGNAAPTLTVSVRCVDKDDIDVGSDGYTGIYTSLSGTSIPVVVVSGAVKYRSVLSTLGFNATDICMHAESEAAVQGL
jgi:Flp pilus assembly protein TadG